MRTFISINPDIEIKKEISKIQNELKEQIFSINNAFIKSIKWETEDKFHITLFFIGDTSESKVNNIHSGIIKLESSLSLNEINFAAKNVNAFPKLKYPRVIILDLVNENNKIFELSNKLNTVLKEEGFESIQRFHPHITLGRIKRENKINLIGLENKTKMDLNFRVKNFYLMESKLKNIGSEYSILKEYKI
ncbi:MAG: RNA 2',3'-cyclic phosphodiesterase [Bacteroidota bacterium]|nr:RNA 2',3'-cyclic phosphodiesterase [Bacteroidota bacterium]